ncbi:hypothetical protein FSP39_000132 [Pinctada imbricata]|uniref:Uncharacterized protein n=1 Tax=Pinctada imbricata TaxID=66713 RepID=A0AA88Y5T4_PINIB|nr:hypothetical protein FSP39_000132 [Pinctada imbricata]
MESHLFKALVVADCKECWPLVKDVVGRQLLGENVAMVPYLEDAKRYDLGAVILKEKLSRAEKMKYKIPGAIQVGWIEDFVTNEVVPGAIETSKQWHHEAENLNKNYYFEEADQKKSDKKHIRVEVLGCEKYVQRSPPREGSLVVDLKSKGFENLSKFFYVWAVYYISGMRMQVTINNKSDSITIDRKIPIGFQMKRYLLQQNGLLGTVKDVQTAKWQVKWIRGCKFRNPMSALPPVPLKFTVDTDVQRTSTDAQRND